MAEFFERPVVCSASLVISRCKVGLGHLLASLFPKVVTSSAVAAELQAKDVVDSAEIEKVLSTIEILPSPPLDRFIVNGIFISPRLRNECLRLAEE